MTGNSDNNGSAKALKSLHLVIPVLNAPSLQRRTGIQSYQNPLDPGSQSAAASLAAQVTILVIFTISSTIDHQNTDQQILLVQVSS